uniref:Uncharacterized protein n=1 Tax=Caenorhabditis japonica TaxID=281687 RepID=A0A8R1IEW4_CAEJA
MPYHLAPTLPHDIPTTSSCPENGNSGGLLHTTLPNSLLEKTHVIDEKMLKSMVRTGVDLNGLPVDIRTVDGKQIRNLSDLISVSHGQTVLITQQNPDDVKTVHGESYTSVPHQLDMDALGPYTADEMVNRSIRPLARN